VREEEPSMSLKSDLFCFAPDSEATADRSVEC